MLKFYFPFEMIFCMRGRIMFPSGRDLGIMLLWVFLTTTNEKRPWWWNANPSEPQLVHTSEFLDCSKKPARDFPVGEWRQTKSVALWSLWSCRNRYVCEGFFNSVTIVSIWRIFGRIPRLSILKTTNGKSNARSELLNQ